MLLFLLPSLFLTIVNKIKIDNFNQLIETREKARLELIRNTATAQIDEIISDIQIIAKSETLNRFINSRKPRVDKVYVAKEFVTMSKRKGRYDQIRFLSTSGKEVVRVDYNNGDPAIIPQFKLQNKSDRYYFKDTIKLKPEHVYSSPLDLNIENGKIEVPYKPMIRIGTNVYQDSNKKGVILVNYYGEKILTRIADLFSDSNSESMMINKDGFWLLTKNNSDLWGFMFNNNKSLAAAQPQLWNEVNSRKEGVITMGEYTYLFNTIVVSYSNTEVPKPDNYWKIITKFKLAKIYTSQDPYLYSTILILTLFLIGALIFSWLINYYFSQKEYIRKLTAISDIIFKKISTGIFITDNNNQIFSVNPATTEITGYSASELIGKKPSIFSSDHHDTDFYKNMWKQLNKNKKWSGEIWNQHKSGKIFPEYLSISVVEDKKHRIQYYIAMLMDITRQKNIEAKLEKEAHFDHLTKLPNRAYFIEMLAQIVTKDKESFALLFIDLDKFKEVNDTQGHAAGDKLLIEVANRFSLCVRDTDIVARLAGDEFTIILKDIKSKSDVESIAKKILQQMQAAFIIGGHKNYISVSIGITFYPDDAVDCEKLIRNADRSMSTYFSPDHLI